jgi:16S rRNA (uracil1498-N3)-methyltransferase
MPRFYTPQALSIGAELALDAAAARHVQVLRMQPGMALTLFNGQGGEYSAQVTQMGRSEVRVHVGTHAALECEAPRAVHIAIGMPANERMEWLVEKATELGAASIQPLMTERTVLRLSGERAEKKQAHWQAIAVAACEQSGRNRVPVVHAIKTYNAWLAERRAAAGSVADSAAVKSTASAASQVAGHGAGHSADQVTGQAAGHAAGANDALSTSTVLPLQQSMPLRCVFSVHSASVSAHAFASAATQSDHAIECLCGPEGGLSPAEEAAAIAQGYAPVSLGPRVLRSETAPLAALAIWSV